MSNSLFCKKNRNIFVKFKNFFQKTIDNLGVTVVTLVQTPLFWGALWSVGWLWRELKPLWSTGVLDLYALSLRPFLTSWLKVGMIFLLLQKFFCRVGSMPSFTELYHRQIGINSPTYRWYRYILTLTYSIVNSFL